MRRFKNLIETIDPDARELLMQHGGLEYVRVLMRGERKVPLHETLGIIFQEAAAGSVTLAVPADLTRTGNSFGIAHGGLANVLCDAAAGFAALTTAARGHFCVTHMCNVKQQRPVKDDSGTLIAKGWIKSERSKDHIRFLTMDAIVSDQKKAVIARGEAIQLIIPLEMS